MRDQSSCAPSTASRRFANLFLCVLLLVTASFAVQAQSGRRPPKQPPATDPKPQPQREPPIQEPTRATPRLPILVVKNLPTVGTSSIYTNIALEGCLEELKLSPSVEVSTSDKDKSRKEASDYAKASTDTYVVLMVVEQEGENQTANVLVTGGDPRTLAVSYVVFTPGTGKVKTSGRTYQGTTRGGVGQQVPNSRAAVDYELRRCGHDVADRVLDALGLARPRPR